MFPFCPRAADLPALTTGKTPAGLIRFPLFGGLQLSSMPELTGPLARTLDAPHRRGRGGFDIRC
jgi:hypothetical protein